MSWTKRRPPDADWDAVVDVVRRSEPDVVIGDLRSGSGSPASDRSTHELAIPLDAGGSHLLRARSDALFVERGIRAGVEVRLECRVQAARGAPITVVVRARAGNDDDAWPLLSRELGRQLVELAENLRLVHGLEPRRPPTGPAWPLQL